MILRLFIEVSQHISVVIFRAVFFFIGTTRLVGDVPYYDKKYRYIFVSNHQSMFDPYAIYSSQSFRQNYRLSPMKFMTSRNIYNGFFRPILFTVGCYPHKIDGVDIINHSTKLMRDGYNIMIFPEGKRTQPGRSRAHSGISRLIAQTSDMHPIVMLVHIEWCKNHKRFRRRHAEITIRRMPSWVDTGNPQQIIDTIYRL